MRRASDVSGINLWPTQEADHFPCINSHVPQRSIDCPRIAPNLTQYRSRLPRIKFERTQRTFVPHAAGPTWPKGAFGCAASNRARCDEFPVALASKPKWSDSAGVRVTALRTRRNGLPMVLASAPIGCKELQISDFVFQEHVEDQQVARGVEASTTVNADPTSTNAGRFGYYSAPDAVIRYATYQGGNCTPCYPGSLSGAPVQ